MAIKKKSPNLRWKQTAVPKGTKLKGTTPYQFVCGVKGWWSPHITHTMNLQEWSSTQNKYIDIPFVE